MALQKRHLKKIYSFFLISFGGWGCLYFIEKYFYTAMILKWNIFAPVHTCWSLQIPINPPANNICDKSIAKNSRNIIKLDSGLQDLQQRICEFRNSKWRCGGGDMHEMYTYGFTSGYYLWLTFSVHSSVRFLVW